MTRLTVDIVRDPAQLAQMADEWRDLWRRAPAATPFQSPDWLIPWWEVFAPGPLATIAVHSGGKLVGFAPLYLETGPLGLRLLPLGIGLSDYCDVLLDPQQEAVAGAAIMAAAATLGPWEIFELTELPPESVALSLPCPAPLHHVLSDASAAPVLPLTGDMAASVPTLRYKQLRRARTHAAKRGEVAIVLGDVDNSAALLNDLIRLHGERWQKRGIAGGIFADKRVVEFHAAALPGLMGVGLARLYALMIGPSVAGAYYGFVHRRRAYAYLQGFAPQFADESPGMIVVGHAIEQAFAEGAEEFHFLRGSEAYKYQWGASDRRNKRRTFIRERADAGV